MTQSPRRLPSRVSTISSTVDNALKIAGEEAVHFHTSLSGVARAKAKLGFNLRPLLWKDSRTSTAAGS